MNDLLDFGISNINFTTTDMVNELIKIVTEELDQEAFRQNIKIGQRWFHKRLNYGECIGEVFEIRKDGYVFKMLQCPKSFGSIYEVDRVYFWYSNEIDKYWTYLSGQDKPEI